MSLSYKLIKETNVLKTYQYKINITAEDLNNKLLEYQKVIKIDGFRKGHVPIENVRKKYEQTAFFELLEQEINKTSLEIIREKSYQITQKPIIKNLENVKFGKNIALDVIFEVFPTISEIKIPSSKIKKPLIPEPTEEDVLKEIKRIFSKNIPLIEVEDKNHKVKHGDILNIDFKGFLGDVQFEGGTAENVDLEIGSKTFIDDYEDQLIGAKAGSNVAVKVKFPENYQKTSLAGQKVRFDVKINKIQKYDDTKLNDDLAKELKFETLEELKNSTKQNMIKLNNQRSDEFVKLAVLKELVNKNDIELPMYYITENANKSLQEEASKDPLIKENEKELLKQKINSLAEQTKIHYIFQFIVKDNNLIASDEEIKNKINENFPQNENASEQYKKQIEAMIENYMKNENVKTSIANQILTDKIYDLLLLKFKIVDEKMTKKELDVAMSKLI